MKKMPRWLSWVLTGVLAIGSGYYLVGERLGQLSSRTSNLEAAVEKHDTIIRKLSEITTTVGQQVKDHYTSFRSDFVNLKVDVNTLRRERRDDIRSVQANIAVLQREMQLNFAGLRDAITELQMTMNSQKTL